MRISIFSKSRALPKNPREDLITLGEFAKAVNLSPQGVRYYVAKRRIRAYKHAGKWYLFKKDIESVKEMLY